DWIWRWWPRQALTGIPVPALVAPIRFLAAWWLFILGIVVSSVSARSSCLGGLRPVRLPRGRCDACRRCRSRRRRRRGRPWCRSRRRRCRGRRCVVRATGPLWRFRHLRLVGRGQDDEHRLALEHRLSLDAPVLLALLREPFEQDPPQLGVAQLAAAEADRHLDAIAVLEEFDRAVQLRREVARADLRREPHFLEGHRALPALVLFFPLRQLVLVLPEVEETSDRRSR